MTAQRGKIGARGPELVFQMLSCANEPQRGPPPQTQVRVKFAGSIELQQLTGVPVKNLAVGAGRAKTNSPLGNMPLRIIDANVKSAALCRPATGLPEPGTCIAQPPRFGS